MHYRVLAVTTEVPTKEGVQELLDPYVNQHWDWFQIGGRYSGYLDGYDPTTNSENRELCQWCEATGVTTQAVAGKYPAYQPYVGETCPQCQGNKDMAKWPTQWVAHERDVMAVEHLIQAQLDGCFAVVTSSGWFGGDAYLPWRKEPFQRQERPPLEWVREEGTWVVVVDCHN